jgi:hypothetical protein
MLVGKPDGFRAMAITQLGFSEYFLLQIERLKFSFGGHPPLCVGGECGRGPLGKADTIPMEIYKGATARL